MNRILRLIESLPCSHAHIVMHIHGNVVFVAAVTQIAVAAPCEMLKPAEARCYVGV